MKQLKLGLTITFMACFFILNAQQKTALHSNGVTTIFSGTGQFTNAYNAASDGDTIYLPGGLFGTYPTIDKRLTIYGAGFHPDSVLVTEATVISGTLTLSQNADSSFIQGLEITGHVQTTYNHKVDKFVISRCKFNQLKIQGDNSTPCNEAVIKECIIIGNLELNNAAFCTISNNLIEKQVSNGENNAIQNNIFFYDDSYIFYYTFNNCDNTLIANNVIFRTVPSAIHGTTEFSTFSNNVFSITPTIGSNTFTGNYNDVDLTTFFVNQSGNVPDFYHDYNLTDPVTYLGLDASEVGLFGGLYPFKEGTLPENPHFQSKTIAPQTDINGDLNIQIQVGAQDE